MKNNKWAFVKLLTAFLIWGSVGVFRRQIPLSSALLSGLRGISGGLLLLIYCLLWQSKGIGNAKSAECSINTGNAKSAECSMSTGNAKSTGGTKKFGNPLFYGITGKQFLAFILSGIALGSNWIMLFESYGYTSVAISTVCNNMAPTIIILFSPLLFQEKLNLRKFICIFVSVLGIFLISGIFQMESFGPSDFIGVGLGLGSAVMYAALIILNKKNPVENIYGRTIIQLLSAGIFVIPYIVLTEDFQTISLTAFSVIMVVVVCVLHTSIAYALYFGSMCRLKAQTVAFMSYLDPTFAIFLSVVLLKEEMNHLTFLGCVLTIGAAIVSELPEKSKQSS